jgi:hypothetical protein
LCAGLPACALTGVVIVEFPHFAVNPRKALRRKASFSVP